MGGMVAWRLVLGLVEAGFFPGVMLILSCWYKVSLAFSSSQTREIEAEIS